MQIEKQNSSYSTVLASPVEMTQIADNLGLYKASKSTAATLVSAITAGAFIALAFAFYVTTQAGGAAASWGLLKLVGGLVFSVGITMVVVCGADLFTSSTLLIVAKFTGKITTYQMLKNWVLVYIGNFIGALFVVALIWYAKQTLLADGQWGLVVLKASQHKLHHGFFAAFCLGVLCNIMVCVGVWMTYAGKTLADKVLVLVLPIAMFVASGFEHCVANMFLIPLGIATATYSTADFWQSIAINSNLFADLTMHNFIFNNLIPVTLGNIVGGAVCIGVTYWYLYIHKNQH